MTPFIPDDRRAIVLCASIAGLLTARVLCGRFAEVVLLERDELPERPARARAPRTRCVRVACWRALNPPRHAEAVEFDLMEPSRS
jgi:flavin-dependent dehydrogenase